MQESFRSKEDNESKINPSFESEIRDQTKKSESVDRNEPKES